MSHHSNQQQQQQPVSVEDALRLFNEVQQLTVRDAQDSERFDAASGAGSNGNGTSAAGKQPMQRTPSNARRGAGPVSTEAELRRQVELSEAVMKKLHAKNKALTQEVEDLRRRVMAGGGGAAPAAATPRKDGGEIDALRRRVAEQDALIESLRRSAPVATTSSSSGRPPLSATNPQQQQHQRRVSSSAEGSENDEANQPADVHAVQRCKLLEQRVAQLQQQVDALTEIKLECIREGESTGRVNKEVKAFFVTSRQKMIDDAAFHEAERALLNQRLAKLELEVMQMRTM